MRYLFLFFILFAAQAPAFAQSSSDRAVLDAEQHRFEAMTRRDTLALRAMLAEDLVYIHSNALTERKQDHLRAISSGKLVYESMVREKVDVRRFGKIALTNGAIKVKGILNGTAFDIHLTYTAVYHKKHGRWQLLNWQSTRIP